MADAFYERAVAFTLNRAEGDSDGLTLDGYAAVFNSPTLINDWDGEYEETIAPGAFRHTINVGSPVLMFDHGKHPLIGSMPIGSIRSLSEDAHGLHVQARMFSHWLNEPLIEAIREGAVDGMSFRFSVVKEAWNRDASPAVRTLREVKLYELGPVVFPAYADTTVALRSLERLVPDLRDQLAADAPPTGTSEEPVAETRGSSDEAAASDDPAPRQSPSTSDERQQVARQIQAYRMGAGKKNK